MGWVPKFIEAFGIQIDADRLIEREYLGRQ